MQVPVLRIELRILLLILLITRDPHLSWFANLLEAAAAYELGDKACSNQRFRPGQKLISCSSDDNPVSLVFYFEFSRSDCEHWLSSPGFQTLQKNRTPQKQVQMKNVVRLFSYCGAKQSYAGYAGEISESRA